MASPVNNSHSDHRTHGCVNLFDYNAPETCTIYRVDAGRTLCRLTKENDPKLVQTASKIKMGITNVPLKG